MNQNKKKILISAGSVIAIFVIYFLYEFFFFVSTDNAQIQAKTLMLGFKVSGYVAKVNIEENQAVRAGDILVELDTRDFENTLHQVSGEFESLQARLQDAEKNHKRLSGLFSKGDVSQQQYDAAKATYLELSHKSESIRSQVEQAKLNLEYAKIKAPSNGFIARKSVEVGALAAPGLPMIGFVSAEERWVVANFKETDLKDIHVGHSVEIKVDSLPGKPFHGEIASISAATGSTFTLLPPDNATGNFTKVVQRIPVRINFKDLKPDEISQLQAGISVEVKVRK